MIGKVAYPLDYDFLRYIHPSSCNSIADLVSLKFDDEEYQFQWEHILILILLN